MNGLAEPTRVTAGVEVGMIGDVELEDYLTTGQACRLAEEMGETVSRSAITQAAKRGREGKDSGIRGAVKMGDEKSTAVWLIPRTSFLEWLKSHRRWNK
jgi:hypothetical protein